MFQDDWDHPRNRIINGSAAHQPHPSLTHFLSKFERAVAKSTPFVPEILLNSKSNLDFLQPLNSVNLGYGDRDIYIEMSQHGLGERKRNVSRVQ